MWTASRARTAPERFWPHAGSTSPRDTRGIAPDAQTVQGLGNRKNEIVLRRIRRDGVQAYPGSVAYARAVRDAEKNGPEGSASSPPRRIWNEVVAHR